MIFSRIAPSAGLRGFVRDYLIAHFIFDPKRPIPRRRYAPEPEQGITFFVRGRPALVSARTGAIQVAPPATIFGQQVKRCDVRLAPEFLMVRVHFQPGALFRVLNVPLSELGDDYFDAELVLGRAVREVSEQLGAAGSHAEMIERTEAYLRRLTGQTTHGVLPVDLAAARLTQAPLRASRDWLARESRLSPRQFTRKFTERIGVGPKVYTRLLRFHYARRFKLAHPDVAWPTVAIEFGYTDYQHLVRDFRQFTDARPNEWLRDERGSPERLMSVSYHANSGA